MIQIDVVVYIKKLQGQAFLEVYAKVTFQSYRIRGMVVLKGQRWTFLTPVPTMRTVPP